MRMEEDVGIKMQHYEQFIVQEQLAKKKGKPPVKIDYDFKKLTSCVSLNLNLAGQGFGTTKNLSDDLLEQQKVPTDRDEVKDAEKKEKRKMLVKAYTKDIAPLSSTKKSS